MRNTLLKSACLFRIVLLRRARPLCGLQRGIYRAAFQTRTANSAMAGPAPRKKLNPVVFRSRRVAGGSTISILW